MSKRTKEGDVLLKMAATMNEMISAQEKSTRFGEVMSRAGFVSGHMVNDIGSKNDSEYNKVSQIMAAVKNQITFGDVTEKFNKFVVLLHDSLELQALALELVKKLSEIEPSYTSPLGNSTLGSGTGQQATKAAAPISVGAAEETLPFLPKGVYVDTTPLCDDDYLDILDELKDVQAQCFNIGTRLKLKPNIIEGIRKDKLDHAGSLGKVVENWLIKKNYNVERFGEPCWKTLVEAVENPRGGNHKGLAIEIAKKHSGPQSK